MPSRKDPELYYENRACINPACSIIFHVRKKRTKQYCSKKCANHDQKTKEKIRESQIKTFNKKYGMHPMKTDATKAKHRASMKANWGVEYALQNKELQQKARSTNLDRNGSENYNNIQQIIATKLNRYGDAQYRDMTRRRDIIWDKINSWTHIDPLFTRTEFNGCAVEKRYNFKCNVCGYIINSQLHSGYIPKCKACALSNQPAISHGELELQNFIKSLTDQEVLTNNRTTLSNLYEIDVYIPELGLAYEYNGLYWHSELKKPNRYHLSKTNQCAQQGIQLIHIFEHQWKTQNHIVKSMIRSKIAPNTLTKIGARKTEVILLTPKEKKKFNINNHIQGDCNSSVNIGLKYKNQIVACMTFGKPRYSKKYDFELLRFSNLMNTRVIGGFSKLLSYIKKSNPGSTIVSYADRSRSKGDVYIKSGFKLINTSKPSYWYFKGLNVFHRHKFMKHRLPKVLDQVDMKLTEHQNMINNGFNRYFDCGQLVFEI